MRCSLGQTGNCYDNALAERMNGILKQEYALGERFVDFQQASRAVDEAAWLYNYERPHLSLRYQIIKCPFRFIISAMKTFYSRTFSVNIFQDLTPIGVQHCLVDLLDEDAYHTFTWRFPTAPNLWQDMITEGVKTGALTY